MPYKIFSAGSNWEVWKMDAKGERVEKVGTHPSKTKAKKHKTALDINVSSKENEMEKEQDIQTEETEVEEVYPAWSMLSRADIPYGARSFADLDDAEQAEELLERLEKRNGQFYVLFWQVWNDFDIPVTEKVNVWKSLFNEFITVFEAEIQTENDDMQGLESFKENLSGAIIEITENGKFDTENRKPLMMDVVVIEPGFGNPADNHYYPKEVLRRDAAPVFDGAKMYATDHRPEEKSVNTEVGKIDRIIRFSETGAPIARVKIWDADFAEDIRNRDRMGELDTLKCSILAKGRAKKGKIDGRETNIVEAILPSKYTNVDFVTNAGAGGRALQLVENDKEVNMPDEIEKVEETEPTAEMQEAEEVLLHENEDETPAETQEENSEEAQAETEETVSETDRDEPTFLAEVAVSETLAKSKLPEISRNHLAKVSYLSEAELQNAIQAETEYIKTLVHSGEVMGLGESEPVDQTMTPKELQEDHQKRIDAILFD